MPADLLFVTSSAAYGETIRSAMDETKFYRVHVVNNKASAIVRADEVGAPLAMLDIALGEEWVREIGKALRTVRPSINLAILCEEKGDPPAFDNLRPWIMVRKPFRMAEFMNAMSKPQTSNTTPTSDLSNTQMLMPWLSEPNKAAQQLTRITLESSAQAALITRKNDLWAYAGGLSQQAAKEVAQTVTRNWDGQKGSDLLRFIRLESTKAEHMLYATRLATDTVLALVFDAETPFSTIRSQASQLLNDFSDSPAKQKPVKNISQDIEQDDDIDIPSISDILNNIPNPNPEPASTPDFKLVNAPQNFDPNQTRVSESFSNASVFSREQNPVPQRNQAISTETSKSVRRSESVTAFDDVEVTAPSRPKTPVRIDESAVTRESPSTEVAKKLIVEPITAGLYHLTYACLLVPRFTSHYITGDLSDRLGEWLPNICIAFGWRLEYLAVRPDYLQWVANVQPSTSPGYLMRIIRQQTSEKIFAEFGRLKKENPSGDFWAPGYLIMGGTQPHPPQLVRDYINQTRTRQGQDSQPLPRK